jgi:hypothetical protein
VDERDALAALARGAGGGQRRDGGAGILSLAVPLPLGPTSTAPKTSWSNASPPMLLGPELLR